MYTDFQKGAVIFEIEGKICNFFFARKRSVLLKTDGGGCYTNAYDST